jgi:hypothetical protein
MMAHFAIAGTPFAIVDCDWPDDLVQRFLDIIGRVWNRMPPLARLMFQWHVRARGGPVIRLASDRGRWGGRYGWAAFNPKDGNLWFHAAAFAHVPDALAVESSVAHELAHAILFVLGEPRHVSGSGHPGREWLVEEVLERWGYDPARFEVWRRFVHEEDDRLPARQPPMADAEFEDLQRARLAHLERKAVERTTFLAEKQPYLDAASARSPEEHVRLAEREPASVPEALAGARLPTASKG